MKFIFKCSDAPPACNRKYFNLKYYIFRPGGSPGSLPGKFTFVVSTKKIHSHLEVDFVAFQKP